MKNKKGFTLIELLAVIVILAVIALIAVPVILNIINKANMSAFKDSAYGILKAADLYYTQQQLNLNEMTEDAEFIFPNDISDLEIKGKLPEQGIMKITKEGDIALAISNGRYCVIKGFDEADITIYESAGQNAEQCSLPGTRFVKDTSELILSYSSGKNINNYKIFGNSVQALLPSEYQQVEYIESTGTQYIDTGFIPNNKSRFVLKTDMTKSTGWAFGVQHNSSSNFDFGFAVSRSNNISQSLVTYARTPYEIEESYHDKIVTIDLNKNRFYIDNTLINEFEEKTQSSSYPVYLFSGNSYGNANTRSKIKVYSFEIYDNDVLVRKFVPCYRKSDKVIGLYDLVNNTFYTNQGTGTFLKGSNISTRTQPTPETPIDVRSVGDKTNNLSNIGDLTFERYKLITLNEPIPAGTYTFSSIINSTDTDMNTSAVSFADINGSTNGKIKVILLPRSANGERVSRTFTTDFPIYEIRFYASDNYQNGKGDTASYTDIQIERGRTATDYEPYGYKIPIKVSNDTEEIITNVYLDEPLRKVGYYTDYIDFETRKLVRMVKKADINEFTWRRRTDSYTHIFETTDNTIGTGLNPFCNMSDNTRISTITGIVQMKGDYWIKGANDFHKIYISDHIHTTVEEFLAPLKGAYIVYPLATPIEETIELPNIPTLKGKTTLEINTTIKPSNMEVIY